MKLTKTVALGALALAFSFGPRAHSSGAEGHACPSFHVGDCEATEGDKVTISIDTDCGSPMIASVTRAGHKPAEFAIQHTVSHRAGYPDAYYGKNFLMQLEVDGRQTPAEGLVGQLDTAIDGQRVSREVRCNLHGGR